MDVEKGIIQWLLFLGINIVTLLGFYSCRLYVDDG